MKTNLIILNYNDAERTSKLASETSKYDIFDHVVVVDNASTDDSFEKLKEIHSDKIAVIKSPVNGGYAKGNNYGCLYALEHFSPDILFIANPDVAFSEETASAMANALKLYPQLGVVAPLVNQGYNVWNAPSFIGMIESLFLVWFTLDKKLIRKRVLSSDESLVKVGVVEGSFYALSAEGYKRVRGFDERTFLYAEEIILSSRMKANDYYIAVLKNERYDHLHSASIRKHYNSSKARTFPHFVKSFKIYNRHYLKTSKTQDAIYDICCSAAYIERLIYDFFMKIKQDMLNLI